MQGQQAPNAWRVTTLLLLANLLNIYDRALPGVVAEPIRVEFGLSDLQIGVLSAAFTVVYAVAGVPIARLSDRVSRKLVIAAGLAVWSVFTGLNGLVWSFGSYLVIRVAVGIGEASYGPASVSLLGDLFPSQKRSRASGLYWVGLPVGILLAFFSAGPIVKYFGSWRATFVAPLIPGLLLAGCIMLIREPARGSAELVRADDAPIARPLLKILRTRTMWGLVVAGLASTFSSYAAGAFLVALLQRYYELPLAQAAASAGLILGGAGLIGLIAGGWAADRLQRRYANGRLVFGACCLALAAAATWYALTLERHARLAFTLVFAGGWLLQYQFYICIFPTVQDVITPKLRATATALYSALLYLLGGAFGPVLVGALSDHFAIAAMVAEGAPQVSAAARAVGLHDALYLVPAAVLVTGAGLLAAATTVKADAAAMSRGSTV